MTWGWWMVPIVILGLALMFAPAIAKWWVDLEDRRKP
jgi:hypothetical protein